MKLSRFLGIGDWEIERLRSNVFAIGTGGVEVRVARDDVALLTHDIEEDAFGGPALMRGNDVVETEDGLHGIAETREARRAGIRFVAAHHGGPLFGGHGGGAAVGEEIDEDGFRIDEKEIVSCG